MFSRWIVTNITSARGTVHCRKTRIPCGDQLVICRQYCDSKCRVSTVKSGCRDGYLCGKEVKLDELNIYSAFDYRSFRQQAHLWSVFTTRHRLHSTHTTMSGRQMVPEKNFTAIFVWNFSRDRRDGWLPHYAFLSRDSWKQPTTS
jgi:hypothetical protein